MLDISSNTNSRVKKIKRLLNDRRFRRSEGLFVVEGTRWMREIAQTETEPNIWLATEDWLTNNHALAAQITEQNQPPLTISPPILKSLADTSSPSGVMAVLPIPQPAWPQSPKFLLLLDQIRDPGNLGTLIRSALAAGIEGIVLGNGCVDPFNPKVVRSSMGALLRIPIQQTPWADGAAFWSGCTVYLADAAGDQTYTAVDWTKPAAIMIGGEANGAGSEARAIIDSAISIPMAHAFESLNAGVAGSIIMFEAFRQKTA